ncbi:MAG: hypothetical protein IPG46_19070 [Actinobacteria bacterium]|nr:hypothetical protein [Actinomycetota bacterium]
MSHEHHVLATNRTFLELLLQMFGRISSPGAESHREAEGAAIDELQAGVCTTDNDGSCAPMPGWIDLRRADRSNPKYKRGRSVGARRWDEVLGQTLHQTATAALTPDHPMLLAIPAHDLVFPDGTVVLLHRTTSYVYHGHALNKLTTGTEYVCRAAGVEGDYGTVWLGKTDRAKGRTARDVVVEITDAQAASGLELLRWRNRQVAANGGRVRAIWSHRQGHESRRSDPGSRIWQRVAIPATRELDLADVSGLHVGSGKPNPDVWTGQARGVKY